MNTSCALCGIPLTPMDTVLGENKLSDGGILCNKCLNKATAVNQDLVNGLINYSLTEIRDLVWSESIEEIEEVEEESVVETSVSRATITFSHSVRFSIDNAKPRRSEEIKDQIFDLNAKLSASVNNEVDELVSILSTDEKLIAIADAKYLRKKMDGLLLATQHRVVFLNKGFFGNLYQNEFQYQDINSILYDPEESSNQVKMLINGSQADFIFKNKNNAQLFCEAIEDYANSSKNQLKPSATYPEPKSPIFKPEPPQKEDPSTVFDKLEKLGRLKESGILTDEEFAEQKKKLLDKL
ncbi:MAG: PH domain-containing protein [Chryseobacterium jejuense]|uniref:PH domain-containing protein n=1 Tax=Chryseobacterium jejuense TaxID=445960 RepID=UPI003D121F15